MIHNTLHLTWIGHQAYQNTWEAMKTYTSERTEKSPDHIWFVEHAPVFTQGQNGKPEHILEPSAIPIVLTDRGGQVTYHGPGQLMVYTLIDLKRKQFTVRDLVSGLEDSIVNYLTALNLNAYAKREAPGVYLAVNQQEAKIASIGLRVKKGCAYHGLAFNIAMDLKPFKSINPCGFSQLSVVDLKSLGVNHTLPKTAQALASFFSERLKYTNHSWINEPKL